MATGRNRGGPDLGRGRNGRWLESPITSELDAEACRLRSRSLTFQQIADAMGESVSTAHDRVTRGMAAIRIAGASELVKAELEKLDRLERAALYVLEQHHVMVNDGRVVKERGVDPETGRTKMVPLEDTGPVLAATKTLMQLSESRRKLLGLDAAVKTEVSGGVTYRFENVSGDDL